MDSTISGAVMFLLVCGLLGRSDAALTDEQKEEVLTAHNHYRASVSPVASNMAKLEWDEDLARLAQYWSVNCELMPNENRHAQSDDFDYVGEIAGASVNYTINYTAIVFDWYFDGLNYDYSQAACIDEDGEAEEEGCERYIQLVWASTYKVGCGAYRCEEIRGLEEDIDENFGALLVVCNYGPGGGFAGEQPYTSGGRACSACPSERPHCEKKLCTAGGADHTVVQVSMATLLLLMGTISTLF